MNYFQMQHVSYYIDVLLEICRKIFCEWPLHDECR